jgi:hypothetical protein
MAKIAVFIKGHADISMESESAAAAIALAHEKAWGMTKKECEWHMEAHGAFVTQCLGPSAAFIREMKKAGLQDWAISKSDSARGRASRFSDEAYIVIYDCMESQIEDDMDELEGELDEEMLERAVAFLKAEYRNAQIGKILP